MVPHFSSGIVERANASGCENHPREKRRHAAGREKNFSHGTTHSLVIYLAGVPKFSSTQFHFVFHFPLSEGNIL